MFNAPLPWFVGTRTMVSGSREKICNNAGDDGVIV